MMGVSCIPLVPHLILPTALLLTIMQMSVRGRVMATLNSSFIFTSKHSAHFDGVMCTSCSSFNITNSIFTDNSAVVSGGVMITATLNSQTTKQGMHGGAIFSHRE